MRPLVLVFNIGELAMSPGRVKPLQPRRMQHWGHWVGTKKGWGGRGSDVLLK